MNQKCCDKVIRQQVKKLLTHINGQGGWSIIGWTRTGLVHDASEEGNKEAEDIAASDLKPHVCFLSPTQTKDCDIKNCEAYKNLLITEAQFKGLMAELETAGEPTVDTPEDGGSS